MFHRMFYLIFLHSLLILSYILYFLNIDLPVRQSENSFSEKALQKMDLAKKKIPQVDKLIENGFFIEHEGYLFPKYEIKGTGMEKFRSVFKFVENLIWVRSKQTWFQVIVKTGISKMRNLKTTDKGVMVLGLAKSGSHLILSILDALGPRLRRVTNQLCCID